MLQKICRLLFSLLLFQISLPAISQHRDAAMTDEHIRMMELVPLEEVTTQALRNGNWSDASIWSNGVPGLEAKVQIPQDITVVYDVIQSTPIRWIRVDGFLKFRNDISTKLVVDTIIGNSKSQFEIGSDTAPVKTGVSAQIIIKDNGPIDILRDPMRIGRGVVLHGQVRIRGENKTSFLPLSVQPLAGSTQLTLPKIPENWRVGDQLAITGVDFRERRPGIPYEGTYDEVRVIRSISGNIVTVDPLTYAHKTPRAGLNVYVANYTRNVTFQSERGSATPIGQRGHVMFMHSGNVNVKYAAFFELGRSNKNLVVNDAKFDVMGNHISGTGTNQRGRYPLHLHRAGTTNAFAGMAAHIKGCAVFGSPGWGYVNHESYALIEDSAAYNVLGSSFVTENGTEIGAFRNNISILNPGPEGEARDNPNSQNIKTRAEIFDLGQSGHGFWLQGRMVEVEGNIVSGATNSAYVFMHRGDNGATNAVGPELQQYPDIFDFHEAMFYPGTQWENRGYHYDKPNIRKFSHNVAMGSHGGLVVIKANPDQVHNQRNIIDNFISIHNIYGVHLEYTAKYTLRDSLLIGNKLSQSTHRQGFFLGTLVTSMAVENTIIEGFHCGAYVPGGIFNDKPDIPDVKFINVNTDNNDIGFCQRSPTWTTTWDYVSYDLRAEHGQYNVASVQANALRLAIDPAQSFNAPSVRRWDVPFVLKGTLYDSYGAISYKQDFSSERMCLVPYYMGADGVRRIPMKALYFDRKTNECKAYPFRMIAPICSGIGNGVTDNAVNLGADPGISSEEYKCRQNDITINVPYSQDPAPTPEPTPDALEGMTRCADENGVCGLKPNYLYELKYGANGIYATKQVGGVYSIGCNNSVFGDPVPGVGKSCYQKVIGSFTYTEPDTQAPSVQITSPSNGLVESAGTLVNISVSASDNIGVQKVELYLNGVLVVTDSNAPYNFNYTQPKSGSVKIEAKAYDAAGNSQISSAVSVMTEIVSSADTQAPSVQITSPSNGSSVAGGTLVNVSVSASDNVGVSKVEFYVNGILKATDSDVPYVFSYVQPFKGSVILEARAYDAAGNSSVSSSFTVKSMKVTGKPNR